MSNFGWIPPVMQPQTTATGVPAAVSKALKSKGLKAFPTTAMSLPQTLHLAVLNTAGAILQTQGLRYETRQLSAEISSRGYRKVPIGQFGNGATDPVPGTPEYYEWVARGMPADFVPGGGITAMVQGPPLLTGFEKFKASPAFPIVIGGGAILLAYGLVRVLARQ